MSDFSSQGNIRSKILILDFGSQYCQLIARRVRELGVYCEIFSASITGEAIAAYAPDAIILSGGPESVTMQDAPTIPDKVFELDCPLLGICYGMQSMVEQLGGQVKHSKKREFGHTELTLQNSSPLFANIADKHNEAGQPLLQVWMSHGDSVMSLPKGFVTIASTPSTPHAAIANEAKRWYGIQFHPEVTHTLQGTRILEQFVLQISHCQNDWQTPHIVELLSQQVATTVKDKHVLLGLSGGVDSAVVAALLQRVIGKQLHCVFIDNGLLRHQEAQQVVTTFREHFGMEVLAVDAKSQFLHALKGVSDPEQKRKIIGRVFVEVFESASQNLPKIDFLAQGTIYPDVIESAGSATGKAHVIKSHHNVGGLPAHMSLALLEPLRYLFKDEVRQLGLQLGLPSEWVHRHPFPGPGLAVRILGDIHESEIEKLRAADWIFLEELHKQGLYQKVSQAFAVLLPCKSVAVMGDGRAYEPVIALRAVTTTDFMTAQAAEFSFAFLQKVANRITNEVAGISRVVYDVTSKPPATIEWE